MEQVATRGLQRVGAHLGHDLEVSVTLVDDDAIRELNRDYRGVDRPTDVLSFAMLEEGEGEPEAPQLPPDAPLQLGDIVISLERAAAQAVEYGHSLERELGFLVTHGVLHLLGYDHQTPEDEARMQETAEAILGELDLGR